MRKVRLTHKNALHHVMNKGIKRENIFPNNSDKLFFLTLLKKFTKKYGIELYAYVVLDNHYHLILKNLNNNLSAFMMELNGNYGLYYRAKYGGKGYVFQNRYKSTIIENENYLRRCIIYLYLNPKRKGLCNDPFSYKYSSLYEFKNSLEGRSICENEIIIEKFSSFKNLKSIILSVSDKNDFHLEINKGINEYIGEKNTIPLALSKFNRRKKGIKISYRRRKTDKSGMQIPEAIDYVENKLGLQIHSVSLKKHAKKIKSIMKILREECLLKYKEIALIYPFSQLKYDNITKILKKKEKK